MPAKPPRPLVVPSNLHGFEVVRKEYIAEYDAAAVLYRHKKTGAEVRLPLLAALTVTRWRSHDAQRAFHRRTS